MNMPAQPRRIRRSTDAVVDPTAKEGNLVRCLKPTRVSLVDRPAVQRAFSIVRKAPEAGAAPAAVTPAKRRVRRSDAESPVLSITFPAGTTREGAEAAMVTYGMKDYRIDEADGVIRAFRSDLQSIAKESTVDVPLADGIVATITRTSGLSPSSLQGEQPNIALVGVTFPPTFDDASATEWLTRNDVDGDMDTKDECIHITRGDVVEGDETRSLEMEDGVVLTIKRAACCDVPDGLIAVIDECAYGNWGWGQLDFAASMADAEFSSKGRMGIEKLEDVLRQIMFYSPLQLDVRKTLLDNALKQFGTFVSNMMDNLPRALLVSVVRSDIATNEEKEDMPVNQSKAPAAAPAGGESINITRTDLQELISSGISEGIKRHDEAKAKAEAEAKAQAEAQAESIKRSDLTDIIGAALKPFGERLEKMEGVTVQRSDTPDAPQKANPDNMTAEEREIKRQDDMKSGAVFTGILGGAVPRGK